MFDENKHNYQQFQPETGHFEMEWINNVLSSEDRERQAQLRATRATAGLTKSQKYQT